MSRGISSILLRVIVEVEGWVLAVALKNIANKNVTRAISDILKYIIL